MYCVNKFIFFDMVLRGQLQEGKNTKASAARLEGAVSVLGSCFVMYH